MYIDIKVYFKLIMETNYDSRFKGKKIVSFPPFHSNFTKVILFRRHS